MKQTFASPLIASAPTASSLLSGATFEVPIYQREYAWTSEEVDDFWQDLLGAVDNDTYFLGLLILTSGEKRYQVVDGQQRIITLTLLAAALRSEAISVGRPALAEKIRADFLEAIAYDTDEKEPRVVLADFDDNSTLQAIVNESSPRPIDADSVSKRLRDAYSKIRANLKSDIKTDPFRRLGAWTEFISTRLFFAVFQHPDAASAYKVFEAINTRGRGLTTAELLKSFVLSQTGLSQKTIVYKRWQEISSHFSADGSTSSFVQYLRHVLTSRYGYVLPRDLFDFVARRGAFAEKEGPTVPQLLAALESDLGVYLQMIDASNDGPAEPEVVSIFNALNSVSVISVRPILLSLFAQGSQISCYKDLLRLVVRRIVVGNLGTGNVERRFGEAARRIRNGEAWDDVFRDFVDLNPRRSDFISQLGRRSFNGQTLAFVRRSILQSNMTPAAIGFLHVVRPKQAPEWGGFTDEEIGFWSNTLGNSFLAEVDRRIRGSNTWPTFKVNMLPFAVNEERVDDLQQYSDWNSTSVSEIGSALANRAADVWY